MDNAVKGFHAAGVPMEKLVVGLPSMAGCLQSRKWRKVWGKSKLNNNTSTAILILKTALSTKKVTRNTATRLPKLPICSNAQTGDILSYDDEESVREKCKYVLANKLGGVMFWEYDSDPKKYLLNEIDKSLKIANPGF